MRLLNRFIYTMSQFLRHAGVSFDQETDPRIVAMKQEISRQGGRIEFRIEQHPDGSWTAESVNLDGILTGGGRSDDVGVMIKDAIYTYFEIPPQLCNDELLRSDNEPVTLMQRVYV